MKNIIIKDGKGLKDFRATDWKDIFGLLTRIDEQIGEFGLEVVLAQAGDDNWWTKIQRKEKQTKPRTKDYIR